MKILCVSGCFNIMLYYISSVGRFRFDISFTLIVASYTKGSTETCDAAGSEKCEATETVSRYIREGISNIFSLFRAT